MYKITVDNLEIELNYVQFLEYHFSTIMGLYNMTEVLFSLNVMGFSDGIRNQAIPSIEKSIAIINEIESMIEDSDLRNGLNDVSKTSNALLDLDSKMSDFIMEFTGKNKQQLRNTSDYGVLQPVANNSLNQGDAILPAWCKEEAFNKYRQGSVDNMEVLLISIIKVLQSINIIQKRLGNDVLPESNKRDVDKLLAKLNLFHGGFFHNLTTKVS